MTSSRELKAKDYCNYYNVPSGDFQLYTRIGGVAANIDYVKHSFACYFSMLLTLVQSQQHIIILYVNSFIQSTAHKTTKWFTNWILWKRFIWMWPRTVSVKHSEKQRDTRRLLVIVWMGIIRSSSFLLKKEGKLTTTC